MRPRIEEKETTPAANKMRTSLIFERRAVVRLVAGKRRGSGFGRGMRSVTIAKLDRGRHTATLEARDGWANKSSSAKRSFRVR